MPTSNSCAGYGSLGSQWSQRSFSDAVPSLCDESRFGRLRHGVTGVRALFDMCPHQSFVEDVGSWGHMGHTGPCVTEIRPFVTKAVLVGCVMGSQGSVHFSNMLQHHLGCGSAGSFGHQGPLCLNVGTTPTLAFSVRLVVSVTRTLTF